MTAEGSLDPNAREAILDWYAARGRTLAFRGTTDPYAILVSETMAQQTQVSRVNDAWSAFVARFGTFQALAAAAPADVLRAWRGLGYNRRALNLWRTARIVVEEHGGVLPSDLEALQRLPGIGPYTARAVGALAFGMPVGAVDTNVRRALGRIVAGPGEIPPRRMQAWADAAVPPGRAGEWTHALMDLGATVCRPRAPRCAECPAVAWCRFAAPAGRERQPREPGPAQPRAHGRTQAFSTTSRWLRGRLMDRLRDAADGEWLDLDAPYGSHSVDAVRTALAALARDGLVELHPTIPVRARLPTPPGPLRLEA